LPFFLVQTLFPSMSSTVMTQSLLMLPVVWIRPAAIATVEYPWPMPVASHRRGGPPLGHLLSNPVSADLLSRFGP
jgi:hypothetical protein